jgi:hypothetical protein
VATLTDEQHRMVQSEKIVEVVFDGRRVVRTGTSSASAAGGSGRGYI